MNIIDIIRTALGNLRRNRLRSFLTISGVVIGIGAITFLVSLGFGLQRLAISKVTNLDALTVVTVNPGKTTTTALDDNNLEKIKKLSNVTLVSAILSSPLQINYNEATTDSGVLYGVNPEYLNLEDLKINQGKSKFSGESAKEILITAAALRTLNVDNIEDLLEEEIDFKIILLDESGNVKETTNPDVNQKLKVIGIIAEDKVKFAYTPKANLEKLEIPTYNRYRVKVTERKILPEVRKAIEGMGFPTTAVKDTVDQIDQVFRIVQTILFCFGLIALFVAAIGIFNTMTISLLERTHEIGIMKAVGARDKDVSRIFTAEASIIGLIGGFLGVASGYGVGIGLNILINFMATQIGGEANKIFYTPLTFAGIVVVFSFIVSTVAGIWPARRAAKLNPIEALRYE